MSWVILSIIAALVWAITNIIDKYVLDKYVKNPLIPALFIGPLSVLASFFVFSYQGFELLSFEGIFWSFLAAVFYMVGVVSYFEAIKIGEVSRVVPIMSFNPLFVGILGAIFLGEIFGPMTYFGVILLIAGAVLISSKDLHKITFGKAFWMMILATIGYAGSSVVMKYLLEFADFWTIFAYVRIGIMFASVPLFCLYLPELISVAKKQGKKALAIMSFNSSLSVIAYFIYIIAMSDGYVTLIQALLSLQSLLVLVIAAILSRIHPEIIYEKMDRNTMITRIVAIILLIFGAMLIT